VTPTLKKKTHGCLGLLRWSVRCILERIGRILGSLLVLVDNSDTDTEFEFSLLISTEFGIQTHQ
jgi:hypothetical protein